MKETEVNRAYDKVEYILEKYGKGGVMQSWGCYDYRAYEDVPMMGHCWSAQVQGFEYKGRIFVALGSKPGTLTIAKEEAFGQVLKPEELAELLIKDLPGKEAVDQLDKWIERGDLTEDEYSRKAGAAGRASLLQMFGIK